MPEEQGSILYRFLTHPDGVPLEFLSADVLQVSFFFCNIVFAKCTKELKRNINDTLFYLITTYLNCY